MLAYFGSEWAPGGVDLLLHILELHDEEGRSTPDISRVIWNKGSIPRLDI